MNDLKDFYGAVKLFFLLSTSFMQIKLKLMFEACNAYLKEN